LVHDWGTMLLCGVIRPSFQPLPVAGQHLSLHIAETTVSFPFARAEGQAVSSAIAGLLQTFAAKQAAERPKRWEAMEYRYRGVGLAATPHACRLHAGACSHDAACCWPLRQQC
jgi:hypothetical protein